jgi:hypothetical protein
MISALLTWKAFFVFLGLGILVGAAWPTVAGVLVLLALANLLAHVFHFGGNVAKAADNAANR